MWAIAGIRSLPGGGEGFYSDRVGRFAGWEHGEEGWALLALGTDDGYVAGVSVGGEEDVLIGGEGESVRGGAGVDVADEMAVVDAVDADGVGTEVGDVEGGAVGGDDALHGLAADGEGVADLVGVGGDFGDGVGGEVGDEDLTAVGLEGEVDGGLADVEEGEEVVCGKGWVLAGCPGVGGGGEADGHDLVPGGAGNEGFG